MAKVRFHVVPNAKQDTVAGELAAASPSPRGHGGAFLADRLRLAEREIVLEQGEKSREKVVRIDALSEPEVRRRLGVNLL